MRRALAVVPNPQEPARQPSRELELEIYRRIFDSSHDAIAIIDAAGRYLEQNPAHRRLIGYSDAELNGQSPAIHLGDDGFALVAHELRQHGHFYGELPSRTRTGEQRTLELSAFTMEDADGNVLCHVGVKHDVTERHRTELELQARVRQQAAVAHLGQEALAGMDLLPLMQEAAATVAEMLDVEYAKVLEVLSGGGELLLRAGVGWHEGMVGYAIVGPGRNSQAGYTLSVSGPVVTEDLSRERRFDDATLREHNVVSGMSVVISIGRHPWGVLAANTVRKRRFTSEDVNFLVAVANILAAAIERKQAEEALWNSKERFRQAQRSANIGAYEWDLQTDQVRWSEELPVLRGLAGDGKFSTWLEHISADDRPRVMATLQRAVREGTEFDLEAKMIGRDGRVIWLVSRGQPFFENGRPTHVAGIAMDITARKESMELLQRAEKLAMIGRLAASIAHEINNPLESVTNLLYLIEHHPNLDQDIRGYASLAGSELSRVAHISRQTLGFYRESANPTTVKLPELVDDIIRLYERKLESKKITVVRDYKMAGEVLVYAAEIRQVLSNLLMNACEASEQGGTVTVRLEQGGDWSRHTTHGVRIIIADNGHGILPEHRSRIFEPFFTTKGEKGTGLGLWVTNGLVQKHGGSIRLRTSTHPDRHGTVFVLFIPEAEAKVTTASS